MSPASSAEEPQDLHECGYPEDSFACRIRHIHMNTGDANAAREYNEERRKTEQFKKYGV